MSGQQIQYTVRAVPESVDRELRRRARAEGRSLNDLLVHSLSVAAGTRQTDLDWICGTWVPDPVFDRILEDQRSIEPEAWR